MRALGAAGEVGAGPGHGGLRLAEVALGADDLHATIGAVVTGGADLVGLGRLRGAVVAAERVALVAQARDDRLRLQRQAFVGVTVFLVCQGGWKAARRRSGTLARDTGSTLALWWLKRPARSVLDGPIFPHFSDGAPLT